jgi:hypothetical protein
MTDRIRAVTVILDRDVRDDDLQKLTDAIRMLAWVRDVVPHVTDHFDYEAARADVRREVGDMLMAWLKDERRRSNG